MRTKLDIPKNELQIAVNQVEQDGPLANRTAVFEAVAQLPWARFFHPKPITAATARQRAQEFSIEICTPPGRKGRSKLTEAHKAAMQAARKGGRTSRGDKFKANPSIQRSLEQMKANTPGRFDGAVRKLIKGSLKAAIKIKCLDCSEYQTPEIRECPVIQCPLWAFRPYQP